MSCNNPTVLSEIVFPPAFGPEMTIILLSGFNSIVCGNVFSFFSKLLKNKIGWKASRKHNCFSVVIVGKTAFILFAYLAFAAITSISLRNSWYCLNKDKNGRISLDSFFKIRVISSRSSYSKLLNSLE